MKLHFLIIWCVLPLHSVFSQSISGRICNEKNEPIAWVNVIVSDSRLGTSSNLEGDFLLRLSPGSYVIIFRCLGYKSDSARVNVAPASDAKLSITLKEDFIKLGEVTVYPDEYSAAEKIILAVIKRKNEYLKRLQNYVYECYTKTTLSVSKGDTSIFGGLLQTQSKAYFQHPDKFKEVILAKKQTANFSEANNIFTIGKIPNFLDENIKIDEEEIPSPLSKNALSYYSYTLLDTEVYDGRDVFTLQFEPKSSLLPLFNGQMKILNDVFSLIYVSANGGHSIKTATRKDVSLEEEFREYDSYFWLPVQVRMNSKIDLGVPGIPAISLAQSSLIYNYMLNMDHIPIEFDNIILSQNILAQGKADSLWRFSQIVPLSREEELAILRVDSIVANASIFNKAMLGLFQGISQLLSLPITRLSDFYHFNRVHGSYIGIGIDSKSFLSPIKFRLIFGNGLASGKSDFNLGIGAKLSEEFSLSGNIFHKLNYLDGFYNYSRDDITLESLFGKNDYADYFYNSGTSVEVAYSLHNFGIEAGFTATHATSVSKNSNFSIIEPNSPYRLNPAIIEGRYRILNVSVTYDNRKYNDLGFVKSPDNTADHTWIQLDYMGNDNGISLDAHRFHLFRGESNFFFRPFPFIESQIGGLVAHLSGEPVLQYRLHLPGSYGSFSSPFLFRTIDQDLYSGIDYFAAFFEINFKNLPFTLLHIPILRSSPYDLLVFYNLGGLNGELIDSHINSSFAKLRLSEFGIGISNILAFLRIDFAWGTSNFGTQKFVVRLLSRFSL